MVQLQWKIKSFDYTCSYKLLLNVSTVYLCMCAYIFLRTSNVDISSVCRHSIFWYPCVQIPMKDSSFIFSHFEKGATVTLVMITVSRHHPFVHSSFGIKSPWNFIITRQASYEIICQKLFFNLIFKFLRFGYYLF